MAEADEFEYTELLPLGDDDTQYRLLTTEGVSTFDTPAGTFLQVEPEAIRHLTATAMREIAHFLRTDHLAQLRSILDERSASYEAAADLIIDTDELTAEDIAVQIEAWWNGS